MFRVLFIFFILGLSLYSLWSVFAPLQSSIGTSSENLDFDSYLSQALERNIPKNERVVFDVSEFIGDTPLSGDGNSDTISSIQDPTSSQKNQTQVAALRAMNNDSSDEPSALTSGSFGTPQTQNFTGNTPVNCDGGLLYDPCLVVGDPVPASGQMYFGSDKYTSL